MATIRSGAVYFSFNKKDLTDIRDKLKRISPRERDGVAERGFRKVTSLTEYQLKRRTLRGEVLNYRTGRFAGSIGSIVRRSGREMIGVVGSGVRSGKRVVYANIHEYGGIIRPRPENKSGFLWIPIRAGGSFAIAQGLSGNRISSSSRILGRIPVRSVTIPARRYLAKTVAKVSRQSVEIMLKEIDSELNKV